MIRTLNNLTRYCAALVLSLALLAAMTGCGAKGDLFLPEEAINKQKAKQEKKKQQQQQQQPSSPSAGEPPATEQPATESTDSQ